MVTDVLIIIGYSFPFFNRKTDDEIFKDFVWGTDKRIYIQDPNAEEIREFLIERFWPNFITINDKRITPIKNVKSFFIPTSF